MKYMFECVGKAVSLNFGGPHINLDLALGHTELTEANKYDPAEQRWLESKELRLHLPFVVTNAGPQQIELKRLEFCAFREGLLVDEYSIQHWYEGENVLPPGTMYSSRACFFRTREMPERITGQVTISMGDR